MNAPIDSAVQAALAQASLDDKYLRSQGRVFMSGIQALVRLPMMQHQLDRRAGHDTAGFISGYRGSPLGSYDQSLQAATEHLKANQVHFQPGVNEELAATAVWGTQQLDIYPDKKNHDGVFAIWYGKGPGVDRCGDVFKHANMAGTARLGGVLAVAGDDHVSKSSTAAHQSDHAFMASGMPVFFPANVQDILDLGLHALALSRFAGLWSAMKTIQEVVESSSSVLVDLARFEPILPEVLNLPAQGLHIRWPDVALAQEERLMNHKWRAAMAYVRANRLNVNVIEGTNDWFGLMASGKAYNDTRQALQDLGLDEATCHAVGIRLHKVSVVWPLETELARNFAKGLQEILVVEEKRQVMEPQLKDALYDWPDAARPRVLGKFDLGSDERVLDTQPHTQQALLRANADLSPSLVARAIAKRLLRCELPADVRQRMLDYLAMLDAKERAMAEMGPPSDERTPWFCSGCPHNTSTRVPEGSRAMAGIGCHFMALWMDRSTSTFSQMGGEGVAWVGQQPFCKDGHVFANLGDGTYFHSGLLAIRQAIAAGVNITYKILYNDAVAMTGGQAIGERPEGHTVLQIMGSVIAEGAAAVAIVTDQPEKYQGQRLATGVVVEHRDALDAVQRRMREVRGTTVIIYDQTCATEKRRRRKRGTMVEPTERVVINPQVCEGCGDCSDKSNCLSIEPLQTPWDRKRVINQSSCNKDLSCLKGFCPSFVTVSGAQPRRAAKKSVVIPTQDLPEPQLPPAQQPYGIVVAGVGGTGVITVGQLLGMAAHLEGKAVVVQDAGGLAQKGGATWSHVQVASGSVPIHTSKVDTASADLVIACDAIVATSPVSLGVMRQGRTSVVLNDHDTPTAAFVKDRRWSYPQAACVDALGNVVGAAAVMPLNADDLARQTLGDSIYTNAILMGYAWQKGYIPIGMAAIERAMELNGVQVAKNKQAFQLGRLCAHDMRAVSGELAAEAVIQWAKKPGWREWLERGVQTLSAYQSAGYAQPYRQAVTALAQAEQTWGRSDLSEMAARELCRLMAYKDEYEVARLHSDGIFERELQSQFEGKVRLQFHLAPPLLARKNEKGEFVKRAYGPWVMPVFRLLTRLKALRGTPLDVFGYSAERRAERALIAQYRGLLDMVLDFLQAGPTQDHAEERYGLAREILAQAEQIRGFGHVKERNLASAQARWHELRSRWDAL